MDLNAAFESYVNHWKYLHLNDRKTSFRLVTFQDT